MKIHSNSLEIIEIKKIPIRIHWSFILILGYVFYINFKAGNNSHQIIWSLIYVLSIFLCVTLHELGHALAAKQYGIHTKSITLYPIGGIASIEKIPEKPIQELIVALAGPIVNVIISAILWTWIIFSPIEYTLDDISIQIHTKNFLPNLATVNLTLAIFNLIPAFPMDGGRVFRSLLSLWIGRIQATYFAMLLGQILSLLFIFAGFIYNPFLIFIGIFIFFGAAQEYQAIKYGNLLGNLKVQDALITQFSLLLPYHTLLDVIQIILNTHEKEFIVINSEKQPIGIMTRDILIQSLANYPKQTPIQDLFQQNSIFFTPNTPLKEALHIIQTHSLAIVPVIYHGKIVGVITLENILETMMISEALKAQS